MKVLLVSWSVPPEVTGSAVIVGNLAKQFSPREMVVAGERAFRRPAMFWSEGWPRLEYLCAGFPPGWRGARWWRRAQIPLMLWRAVQLVRRERCSQVLGVFPNEEFLLISYLTACWTRLPLLAYFHNTYIENRRGLALRFANWLQNRVFARAKHVFLMSEGMADLYRQKYPALKCSALLHSFNEEIPVSRALPEAHSPLRLVICGNINETCREATVRFADAVVQMEQVSLTLLSGTPRTYLEAIGVLRQGVSYETVSRDQVIDRLQEADVVVLPHGFNGASAAEEYETIFPTKTIEYLICGRPILAHTPPGCYLTTFLKKHGCALVVDKPSPVALIDAIEKLRTDHELRRALVTSALRTAQMFCAPRVAALLRRELEVTQ